MTQASETENRFARLEALTLELAAVNLRHDSKLDRVEAALERQNHRMDRIEAILAEMADYQREVAIRHEQRFSENEQAIAGLTASIVELRNIVADNIQR
jgi:hypothetical protein